MKKSLITLSFLSFIAFSVNAQDAAPTVAPSGSEFKPAAGNITVEVLATSPFAGSGNPFQLSGSETGMPALRFRYFINESTAFRLNFSIDAEKHMQDLGSKTDFSGSQSGNANSSVNGNTTPTAYKLTSNRFLVAIAPGLEFHKGVSERLSVYYGFYVDFAMQSAKGKITGKPGSSSSNTVNNGTAGSSTTSAVAGEYSYEVKGQNLGTLDDLSTPTGGFSTTNQGTITSPSFGTTKTGNDLRRDGGKAFTRLGLMGVLGADFYITKGLYLGLEVNWGFANTSYKKVTVEEKVTNINTTTTTPQGTQPTTPADVISGSTKTEENKDNNWNIAPAVNAAFRFGFWF